jgi:Family of unknown function (DUF6869)
MIGSERKKVVDAWVMAQDAAEGSSVYLENEWAVGRVFKWSVTNPQPDLVWQFVLATYNRNISEDVFGMLAAGPLEDLLSTYGPDYIDRVEELAAKDARFNRLLLGVWQQGMTDDVWNRVQAARVDRTASDS